MKQVTIRIEGFATVSMPDDWDGSDVESIPVKLDVFDSCEHDDSRVETVHETEIITKKITTVVPYENTLLQH